jgi:hypothetical protein
VGEKFDLLNANDITVVFRTCVQDSSWVWACLIWQRKIIIVAGNPPNQ